MNTKTTYAIQPAQREHLSALPEIERAAAHIFPKEVLPSGLEVQTTPIPEFEDALQRGLLLVAVSDEGVPMGFAHLEEHGETLHLAEIDVHPDHQGQGIGTAMMEAVFQLGRAKGYRAVSLTTFTTIPWNAPWYEKLGFRALEPGELDPILRDVLQDEARRGLDPSLRVAMLKCF